VLTPAEEAAIIAVRRHRLLPVDEEEQARIATQAHSFEEMFELSMKFLSSPNDICEKGDLMVKMTILRLVFSCPLTVSRKRGVQA